MNKNKRWGIEIEDNKPVHVVLFISRNKDNKKVSDFNERRESFITTWSADDPRLLAEFKRFINLGLPGEVCRMYYSVNARDPKKIHTALLHYLIDNPGFNLCSIQSKIAGIAATKECAAEKHWLIDFDASNLAEFEKDLDEYAPGVAYTTYTTFNGFAVITERGFDTRKLTEKWGSVATVKKDDMKLCVWGTQGTLYPELTFSVNVSGKAFLKRNNEIPY